MTQEPPYKPSELPDHVVAARTRAADDATVVGPALRPELDRAVAAARIVLDALAEYHAGVADRTNLDLSQDSGSRSLALWESTAAAIGLARAFVDLVDLDLGDPGNAMRALSADCRMCPTEGAQP